MKLTIKNNNVIIFEDVERGEIFRDNEGNYLIKVFDPLHNINSPELLNAIDLETGALCYIDPLNEVYLVKNYKFEITE